MDYGALGRNIKQYRMRAGLRQEDLAELTNYSDSHVGMVENGKTIPSLDMVVSIANALNVTVDQLLWESFDCKDNIYLQELERRILRLPEEARITACKAVIDLLDIIEEVRTDPALSK